MTTIVRYLIAILIIISMLSSMLVLRFSRIPLLPYSPIYRVDHPLKVAENLKANARFTTTVFNPPPSTTILTVAILTSPRPNNDIHLLTTIHSIIDQFKHFVGYYERETLNERFMLIREIIDRYQLQIVVVNHFGEAHGQFYAMQQIFEDFLSSSVQMKTHTDDTTSSEATNVMKDDGKMVDVNPLSYLIQIHCIDDQQVKLDIEDDVFLLQKAHAASLLKHASTKHREKLAKIRFKREQIHDYIMLLEDDFPACSQDELARAHAIPSSSKANGMSLLYHSLDILSEKRDLGEPFCGLFVATGGSGLVFSQSSLEAVVRLLDQRDEELLKMRADGERMVPLPHDVMIQRCLSGGRGAQTEEERRVYAKYCQMCEQSGSLHVSGKLWFKHIGHFSSTVYDRYYDVKKWSCGTIQPFASNRFISRIQ